ncbi:MAG TPA: LysM domain-containing protein [Solirubrobacterales bacterium]|nr:LysM domain-containing protein [Solirubrobacterales bacterium]
MVVLIATTLGGGDSGDGDTRSSGNGSGSAGQAKQGEGGKRTPQTYEVQTGDTLNAISGKTGVPVGRIERLNPGVDPQILIAGERLKLK